MSWHGEYPITNKLVKMFNVTDISCEDKSNHLSLVTSRLDLAKSKGKRSLVINVGGLDAETLRIQFPNLGIIESVSQLEAHARFYFERIDHVVFVGSRPSEHDIEVLGSKFSERTDLSIIW